MKRHFLSFLALILVSVCALSPPVACAQENRYGGTLRVGTLIAQFDKLDPRYTYVQMLVPSVEMVYDTLLQWGEKGYDKPMPMLATSVDTKDNKVWTFRLRKGVKFHNGREMTAKDVKTNFDWIIETPKGWKPVNRRGSFVDLQKAEVVDKYTVRVTLKRPFAPFARLIASDMRAIAPPEEVEKHGEAFTFHPVGTGPYKATYVKEDKVVLERFDGYWGPKPNIDRIEYTFYRSDDSRLMALQKGDIDIAYLGDDAKPVLERDKNLAYMQILIGESLNRLHFNFRRWPMNDIRFRKAVWMGADWKNIAINAYPYKSGNHARTLLEYSKYFNPDALKLVPPFDQEQARKLIQAVENDAGKKIPPIYWLDSNQTERKALGELAKIQLGQIGVPLNLQLVTRQVYIEKLQKDPKVEWDIAQYGMGFAHEPYVGFCFFLTNSGYGADGKSLGGYSSPEMDRAVERAVASLKEAEKIKHYRDAETLLLKDAATVPLFPTRTLIAHNKKVKGLQPNPFGSIPVTTTWSNMWIEK